MSPGQRKQLANEIRKDVENKLDDLTYQLNSDNYTGEFEWLNDHGEYANVIGLQTRKDLLRSGYQSLGEEISSFINQSMDLYVDITVNRIIPIKPIHSIFYFDSMESYTASHEIACEKSGCSLYIDIQSR